MKKYTPYVDMKGYVTMAKVEDGDWVQADVAQALYDALVDLKEVEESDYVGVEWKMSIRLSLKKAAAALSMADGKDNG